jgi:uncharacterized protein YycO
VLFKSARGLWGALAAGFNADGEGFGHVGMIVETQEGALAVVHAGGDPATPSGRVQESSLDLFLADAKSAALYRPSLTEGEIVREVAFVRLEAERNTPFDRDFSLDTDDRLYCTELIWRALKAASGRDPVPQKSSRSGKTYISLDDLAASAALAEVRL